MYAETDNYKIIYKCKILKSINKIANIWPGKGRRELKANFISKGIWSTHTIYRLPDSTIPACGPVQNELFHPVNIKGKKKTSGWFLSLGDTMRDLRNRSSNGS